MSKRTQVVLASALMVVGIGLFTVNFAGGPELTALSLEGTGFDLTKYFLWGGVGLLVVSALLYIRASAD